MKRFKIDRQKISYSLVFSVCLHFGFLAFMVKVNNEKHFVSSNEKLLADAKVKLSQFDSVKIISKKLGNTTSVCKKYYIHPKVLESFLDGTLDKIILKSKT